MISWAVRISKKIFKQPYLISWTLDSCNISWMKIIWQIIAIRIKEHVDFQDHLISNIWSYEESWSWSNIFLSSNMKFIVAKIFVWFKSDIKNLINGYLPESVELYPNTSPSWIKRKALIHTSEETRLECWSIIFLDKIQFLWS